MSNGQNLLRFIKAQERDYEIALTEIKSGRKRSHWMWYIFPQIQGLGFSETSKYYAIRDLAEAKNFVNHPILGSRLIEICSALMTLKSNNATAILGSPDDIKLLSSMTLFSEVSTNPIFNTVLEKFFQGKKDNKTLQIINSARNDDPLSC